MGAVEETIPYCGHSCIDDPSSRLEFQRARIEFQRARLEFQRARFEFQRAAT